MNETGVTKKSGSKWHYSTISIVYVIILAVIGSLVSNLLLDALIQPIKQMGVAPWFPNIFSGHHVLWMVLAFGITKKHGSPTLVALIKGFLEMWTGHMLGPAIILLNLLEGASVELGFFITSRIKNRGRLVLIWGLAGALGNFTQPPAFWFFNGKLFVQPWFMVLMAIVMAFISGFFIAGLLGLFIMKTLNAAGIGPRWTSLPKEIAVVQENEEKDNGDQ